jgi:hypothetical protein
VNRTLVLGAVTVLMISTALAQQPSTSNPAETVNAQSSDELLAFHLRPLENDWISNCKLSGTKMPQTNE